MHHWRLVRDFQLACWLDLSPLLMQINARIALLTTTTTIDCVCVRVCSCVRKRRFGFLERRSPFFTHQLSCKQPYYYANETRAEMQLVAHLDRLSPRPSSLQAHYWWKSPARYHASKFRSSVHLNWSTDAHTHTHAHTQNNLPWPGNLIEWVSSLLLNLSFVGRRDATGSST